MQPPCSIPTDRHWAPYFAAYRATSPGELDPVDRMDICLELARHAAHVYGEVVDAVRLLESYERGPAG